MNWLDFTDSNGTENSKLLSVLCIRSSFTVLNKRAARVFPVPSER